MQNFRKVLNQPNKEAICKMLSLSLSIGIWRPGNEIQQSTILHVTPLSYYESQCAKIQQDTAAKSIHSWMSL